MAKATYSDDKKSVTYRGKTFRVGDMVLVNRDTGPRASPIIGQTVKIVNIGSDEAVLCEDEYTDCWRLKLESLFEYSEDEEGAERKPWQMPELKPWMRVVNQFSTYVIVEVGGVLTGLRAGGCENIVYLRESATEIYGAPFGDSDTIAHYQSLSPEAKGGLLWSRSEADKQRQTYEAEEARRQEILRLTS